MEQFDLFGHPFELNYKGNYRYRTCFGGLMSIVFVVVMISLSAEIVLHIAQSDVKSVGVYHDYIDLHETSGANSEIFYPYLHEFKIAIGFTEFCPLSIGRFKMK